jgi:hypothetical protein
MFNWILFWIFYFESIYIESRHVAPPHWSTPIHSDHCRGALDLIRSGCTRSSRTGSISELFWGVRWRSDSRKESEESSPWWIRVTVTGEGSAARGWMSARFRWAPVKKERSTGSGEASPVALSLALIASRAARKRRLESSWVPACFGLGCALDSLQYLAWEKASVDAPNNGDEVEGKRRWRWYPRLSKLDGDGGRTASTDNRIYWFRGRFHARDERRRKRGSQAFFRRARRGDGVRVRRGRHDGWWTVAPCSPRALPELDGGSNKATPPVIGGSRPRAYRFRDAPRWVVGFFLDWAKKVPRGLFRFSDFLFLFFILISELFQIFCKCDSN